MGGYGCVTDAYNCIRMNTNAYGCILGTRYQALGTKYIRKYVHNYILYIPYDLYILYILYLLGILLIPYDVYDTIY